MRISDWSSDVCSSDLALDDVDHGRVARVAVHNTENWAVAGDPVAMRRGEGREAIVSRGADDRSKGAKGVLRQGGHQHGERRAVVVLDAAAHDPEPDGADPGGDAAALAQEGDDAAEVDRKSTRLNSSH